MNDSEVLRPMFSYSIWPIIFIIILIGIIIFFIFHKKKIKPTPIVIQRPEPKNIWNIKDKYRAQLNELQQNIKTNKITSRKAYQRLSIIIRNFIFEMTQIKVQNYSLEEIKKVNMPILTTLVEEYYDPEFSKDSTGDILESLEKTRMVLERWN